MATTTTDGAAKVTVADLVARLEAGVASVASSEGWREYLALQAKLHQYSLGNTLLILAQMPTATGSAGSTSGFGLVGT